MTTDTIGGKRITPQDRKALQRLYGGDHIHVARSRPNPFPYRWMPSREDVNETDVLRWIRYGWVSADSLGQFSHILVLSDVGREALRTGWRGEPMEQIAFFPKTSRKRAARIED